MSVEITSKRPLTQLQHEIEEAEATAAKLEAERNAITKDISRAGRRLQYLRLAQSMRKPSESFELWPFVAILIAAGFVGIAMFMIAHLISGSFAIALLGMLLGAVSGAGLMSAVFYRPADALLPAALAEAESHVRLAETRLREKVERITETKQRLERLLNETARPGRIWQLAKGRALATQLENDARRGVGGLCRRSLSHARAQVERVAGGEDANLVANFGTRRVAVLTRGEGHNVDSATVRQALAAKERRRCDACAVIINRRFTGAAQHFAQHKGCAAIGAGEFPEFAMGKLEL